MSDQLGSSEDASVMSVEQFRYALDAALEGRVVSETGASGTMDELLIDVAVTDPGTPERRAAVSAARRQLRAEQGYAID